MSFRPSNHQSQRNIWRSVLGRNGHKLCRTTPPLIDRQLFFTEGQRYLYAKPANLLLER